MHFREAGASGIPGLALGPTAENVAIQDPTPSISSIGVVVPSRLHALTKLVDALAAMRSLSQFYVGICRIVNPRVELRIPHYPVRNRAGSE